ncbi:MAG: hypothetical protein KJ915_13365 [Candidatus Omnitrophica bacterium]|nr:hypothetical protein [Candidatus Omnitrophota bacterium]
MKQKIFKKIPQKTVRIFKISNRKGYGALCMNNLTEGTTPAQAYMRMIKAVKRNGCELPNITTEEAKKCIVSKI